ncbi:MAG TPA: aspartyl protease family protein [Steroidobacteraceae bacterium]|nr:aspartyl protease family protein [Steroidobacteraceae bacterium]
MRICRHSRRFLQAALIACSGGMLAIAVAADAVQSAVPASNGARVLSTAEAQYDDLFACPTTLDHIGRVVVPVQVDGQGPFRFVIDTGASHSSISPGLVHKLGLTVSKVPLINLEGITGSAPVPAVKIGTLRAGSLVIRNTQVPVLSTPMMAGADGILGVAGFTDMTMLVDFDRNRVRLARELGGDVRFDYSRVHTQVVAGGLMAVPAYVGNVRVLAIIDTGSERTLGNRALRAALHLQDEPGRPEPVTVVYGATKQVEVGHMAMSPIISVGPLRIGGVELIYGGFHIFKVWDLEDRPAVILGMDVLGSVDALGFDFRRQDLFVASAGRPGRTGVHSFEDAKTTGGVKVSH